MAITKQAFLCAAIRKRVLICCLFAFNGCTWHGVRPIFARMTLKDQVNHAESVVFAQVLGSRWLQHRELVPTSLHKESSSEAIWCEGVEKMLQVRQVLKGPTQAGTVLRIVTYEVRGIPSMTRQPAIFFLNQEGGIWRPLTDFDHNTIALPGYPDRSLVLTAVNAGPTALERLLIDAFLDPRNASGWPWFKDELGDLVGVSLTLATESGILTTDPGFITDRLVALANSADPDVAAAGRKALLSRTGMCNERKVFASDWAQTSERNLFLQGKIFGEPGKSPEEREQTYWALKRYSCSKLPEARAKAEALLNRFFSARTTVACAICSGS